MPQVRINLSEEAHRVVKVEAALRELSIADTVVAVLEEVLGFGSDEVEAEGPAYDTPETVAVKAERAKAIMAQAQEAVAGWKPRGDFSKAAQAAKKKGKP